MEKKKKINKLIKKKKIKLYFLMLNITMSKNFMDILI